MSKVTSVRNSPVPQEQENGGEGKTETPMEEKIPDTEYTESRVEDGAGTAVPIDETDKQNGVPYRPDSSESTEEILSTPGFSSDQGLSIETGLETVYIEQRNGSFKPTSTSDLMFSAKQQQYAQTQKRYCSTALDMAIMVQKIWYCLSNFCFGILAGVAALHLIIMFSTLPISRVDPESNLRTVQLYSNTAFILPIVFYLCLIICLISLIDRYDTSQLENDELKDTFSYKFLWLVIILYLLIFLIHTLSAKYDDLFVLYEHDDSFTFPSSNLVAHLGIWRWLDSSKCVLCVIGWMLVSLVPSKDFLLHHLKYLKTYDLDSVTSPT